MHPSAFINFNGELKSTQVPVFYATNRAFRYGDRVFETIRAINGKPLWLPLHYKRLTNALKLLKFSIPDLYSEIYFYEQIISLLKANKFYQGSRIRLSIFREDGGFYTPENNNTMFCIEAEVLENNCYQINKKGLLLDIYPEISKENNIFSAYKINSIPYILAGIYRNLHQLDDCLLLNAAGNVVETIASNIFIVIGNHIITPYVSEGCINGVIRQILLGLKKIDSLQVTESVIEPGHLLMADEIFLTNAIVGLQWVVAFKEKRYYSNRSKKILHTLLELAHE